MTLPRRPMLADVLLAAAAAFLGLGCQIQPESELATATGTSNSRPSEGNAAIVARVGERTLSAAELDAQVAQSLYEVRLAGVQRWLASAVVERKSDELGLEPKELHAQILEKVAKGEAGSIELAGLPLEARQGEELRSYVHGLKVQYGARVDAEALGRPELELQTINRPSSGTGKTLVFEYADPTSSYTSAAWPGLRKLMEELGDSVTFVFKQKPTDESGVRVARLALCSAEQGAYLAFRDWLQTNYEALKSTDATDNQSLLERASGLSLDLTKATECLSSTRPDQVVSKDIAEAKSNGFERGTPFYVVGDQRIAGVPRTDQLKNAIETELVVVGKL